MNYDINHLLKLCKNLILYRIKYHTLCGCIINTKIHKYNGVKYNIQFDLLFILLCLENLIPIFVNI